MWKKAVHIIAYILIVGSCNLHAQSSEANISHITEEQGLSDNLVTCFEQDRYGFMWIGTTKGLNRYDGNSFKTYHQRETEKGDSLSGEFIRAIHYDSRGYLWIGTEGKGLNRYDPVSETFVVYQHDTLNSHSLPDNSVWTIYEDRQNRLWLGTRAGLSQYSYEDKTFSFPEISLPDSINGLATIKAIHQDLENNLWLGTDNGLIRWNPDTYETQLFRFSEEDENSISNNSVQALHEGPDGVLYIGTRRGFNALALPYARKSRFNLAKEKGFNRLFYNSNPDSIQAISEIQSITGDSLGNLWVGTFGAGLLHFQIQNGQWETYSHDVDDPGSLSSNDVFSIFQDASGLIWIGTFEGANQLNQSRKLFQTIRIETNSRGGYQSNDVYALTEDLNGVLWYGTDQGLTCRDASGSNYETFVPDIDNPSSLSDRVIYALLTDQNQNIWVGTSGGGIDILPSARIEANNFRFDHINSQTRTGQDLLSEEILCLYEDKEGLIWIGTPEGVNVWDYENGKGSIHAFTEEPSSGIQLSNSHVQAILQDKRGYYWLGTRQGLNCIDRENQKNIVYSTDAVDSLLISNDNILSLSEDRMGNIWAGTEGGGVIYINPETNEIRAYTTEDGLPNNVIYSILTDKLGHLWISTDNGLCRGNKVPGTNETNFIIYTEEEDELPSNTFNVGAAFQNSLGRIYMGGSEGIVAFQPEQIDQNESPPPVVITDFELFYESVSVSQNGETPLEKSIIETQKIELDYTQNVLGFKFAALNYFQNNQNKFSYQLEGADAEWNYINQDRSVTFIYLDPGNYVFRVKAANSEGIEGSASIEIQIRPPFYQSAYFYIGLAFFIALAIFGYIRWRVHSLEQNKRILEQKVEARTEELSQKTVALESALTDLKSAQSKLVDSEKMASLGQLTAGVAHEINNPITFVIGNVKPLKRDLNDIMEILQAYADTVEKLGLQKQFAEVNEIKQDIEFDYVVQEISDLLTGIEEGANRTSSIVKGLRNFSRLDEDELKEADVNTGIESTLLILRSQFKGRIQIIKEYGDLPSITCYPGKLNQVYMNILSNAIQAIEGEGTIKIETYLNNPEEVVVIFTDSGKGMPESVKRRIFEPFFTTKAVGEGTGLGLSITFGIIQDHKGKINVESEPGKGTTFILTLPVNGPELV